MDLGTILLVIAVVVGCIDIIIMLLGTRVKDYDALSFGMSATASLAAIGALFWMALLIFNNQFQYEYVFQTTSTSADWMLKISALWAGQSGSLVFWTFLSFVFYFTFRIVSRGYEDDMVAYRAAVIMAASAILIGVNALIAQPFRITATVERTEGLGLNPLLRTFWNVVHPPLVFIAYALILVPFAVRLAGFTVRSEVRNQDKIPVIESFVRFTTVLSWIILSLGIVIGGYWAYIVLGWGGYWAWDPVETTSLIPWLLLTAYFHAKPILRKNDVLRDSFLVFAYLTVLFATWVTRSGVLNSVHGFSISIISWSMFATLIGSFLFASLITAWSGYRDIDDEDETSNDDERTLFDRLTGNNLHHFSIKIALVGILVVTATSVIGVLLPAAINLQTVIADPTAPMDEMVSIGIDFFRLGFYASTVFLLTSAFFCMDTSLLRDKTKSYLVVSLLGVGSVLGVVSYLDPDLALPTLFWIANMMIPLAVGAVVYVVLVFVRNMSGREKGQFTMRKIGRIMLHLGLVLLILGVFMSENVVTETNAGFQEGDMREIAPNTYLRIEDIDLEYWVHERDFKMTVTVLVIEGEQAVGIGIATIQGHPEWGSVSHNVYVQSNALRDVFIAVTGFSQVAPGQMSVSLHVKILPLISFVWIGAFFMISSIIPMLGIELKKLRAALATKDNDMYDDVTDDPERIDDQ